jgi:DNA polymerase elongation subunit (family B)
MSYVDAIHDRKNDKILVAERHNGQRVLTEHDAEYVFYYEANSGSHQSIFGDPCKKYSTNHGGKFRKELEKMQGGTGNKRAPKIFESDINPVFRSLATHYMGVEAPVLNIGFFDIEVDWNPDRGWATTVDPFSAITAISVYLTSISRLVTLVLLPPTYTHEDGQAIADSIEDTFLFTNEGELMKTFIDLIEDVDVLSGWNSTGFDIPYIVNRMTRVLGKDYTRDLCLWRQYPREREYMKFKRTHKTYDLVGRVHLDYLDLYQKHNTQQLHSYRLDFVGEIEVKENKVPYQGTLDDLYKKDFHKFIEYNRQDTLLLYKIDKKKRFIELSNQVAHGNCVLLKTTLGSVSLVETAIINEMHAMGFVVPDRKNVLKEEEFKDNFGYENDDDDGPAPPVVDGRTPVVGAYVAPPKTGLWDEIGCVDINSLYPSVIRSLNMSPETIVGQIRLGSTMDFINKKVLELGPKKRAEAWEGVFACFEVDAMHRRDDTPFVVDFEDGTSRSFTGLSFYDYIFNPANKLCVTANGTIFSTKKSGIIPQLLAKWYSERKQMQAKEEAFTKRKEGKPLKDAEAAFVQEVNLPLTGDLTPEQKELCIYWEGFWNQRQQARKILLNSLYGALLNEGLRFYDERLGQSVTLTGRSVVRHMNSKINEIITGTYQIDGDAIIYSDTDSSYFTAKMLFKDVEGWTRDQTIELYDQIAEQCNATFPEFMNRTFNTGEERGGLIKAGRELVASKGLFIKKKKYAVLMYDKDGHRLDIDGKPGKLKVMGLDLKRADTPKYMQEFLSKVLMDLLCGVDKANIFDQIRAFRKDFKTKPGWDKGAPKKVSALADYVSRKQYVNDLSFQEALKLRKGTKVKVNKVSHVEAAMNWNKLCKTFDDKYSMRIGDGSKIVVCKLKHNMLGVSEVAYPIDELQIPQWFKDLPFNHEAMETTIIDNKLNNLFGVLKWNMEETKERMGAEFFTFA